MGVIKINNEKSFKEIFEGMGTLDMTKEKRKNLPQNIKIFDDNDIEHNTRALVCAFINSNNDYETLVNGEMTSMEVLEIAVSALSGAMSFIIESQDNETSKKILFKVFVESVNKVFQEIASDMKSN